MEELSFLAGTNYLLDVGTVDWQGNARDYDAILNGMQVIYDEMGGFLPHPSAMRLGKDGPPRLGWNWHFSQALGEMRVNCVIEKWSTILYARFFFTLRQHDMKHHLKFGREFAASVRLHYLDKLFPWIGVARILIAQKINHTLHAAPLICKDGGGDEA